MKKYKRLMVLASLGLMALSACSGSNNNSSGSDNSDSSQIAEETFDPAKKIKSDSLYVTKVEGMPKDFYCGMDVSSVISLENAGVKYYNFEGEEEDLFKILADNGVNLIRVRVWNDPYTAAGYGYGGGNCDINKAVLIGQRTTRYGMRLLVDFHYSDFWADPSRQTAPKAWKNMDLATKKEALYDYTKESLQKLKDASVDVAMVQVGNETNAYALAGEKGIDSFATLVNRGYDAVKEIYPEADVALHFTDPQKGNYLDIAEDLYSHNVKYDVFGSSYYPFFHGSLRNLTNQLGMFASSIYGNKKVMVMETSYANNDEDTDECGNQFGSESDYEKAYPISVAGQANNVRDVAEAVVKVRNNIGIGVCYWEGAWLTSAVQKDDETNDEHRNRLLPIWGQYGSGWANQCAGEYDKEAPKYSNEGTVVDNQAFFDKNGKPYESLKVFNLMKYGNDAPEYVDGVANGECTFMTKADVVLPETVDAIYNSNKREPIAVSWNADDELINSYKASGPGTYDIDGTVTSDGKTYSTICKLTLKATNYVKYGDFEVADDDEISDRNESWKFYDLHSGERVETDPVTKYDGSNYAVINRDGENNSSSISGKYDVHTWCVDANTFNYELESKFTLDEDKTLNLRYVTRGGCDIDTISESNYSEYMTVYVAILDGDTEVAKLPGYVTTYSEKVTRDLAGISLTKGKEYTVRVHLEAKPANFYLNIDDINLYDPAE